MGENKQKKQKIVFILPALSAGGAERVLITLMNNLDRSRFDPVFISVSADGPMRDIIDPDIPYHCLNGRRVSLSVLKLYTKLKALQPDIVVSTMAHMNFCLLLLRPFFPKVRFVVREAVTPSFIFNQHPRLTPVLKLAYRHLYRSADIVISPAQAIIDEFRDLLGMSCENHALLYNPVDMSRIRAAENEPLPMLEGGEQESGVRFVAAGRLHYQKGFDRLITRLADMKTPHPWTLTILGEGEERCALENLIREKGLEDKVSLPGLSAAPWPHYAAADCFLLPSLWEGLPNVVLESLACGTPVIATSTSGGMAEIQACADKGGVKGSVTVVENMDAFIKAMEAVTPSNHTAWRKSLLPKEFSLDAVVERFTSLIS